MAFLLAAIAAVAGGSLMGKLSSSNRDDSIFLDSRLQEIRAITHRIDRNLESGIKNCNSTLERLQKTNQNVFDTTFKTFKNIAENITNVELSEEILKVHKIKLDFKYDVAHIENTYAARSKMKTAALELLVPGSYLVTQAVYSVKLETKIAEANSEVAKVNALCESAKREIAKMRSITNLAETAIETIETLKAIADNSLENLSHIMEKSGIDYNKFAEDEKNAVWITFKLISALNELINTEILTENGNISAKFRKFVGDINDEYIEA